MEGKKVIGGILAILLSTGVGVSKCSRGIVEVFNIGKVGKNAYRTEKIFNTTKRITGGVYKSERWLNAGKGVCMNDRILNTSKIGANSELRAGKGINVVKNNAQATNAEKSIADVKKIENEIKTTLELIDKAPLTEGKHVNHFVKLELTEDGFCLNKGQVLSEQEFKKIITTTDTRVSIQGNLTETHVNKLQKMDIDIVFNENAIKTIQQEKFVYIFASPREDIELYKIFQLSSDIPNSILVDDYNTLIKAIENAKNSHMRPIIIYDSKTELLFNHSISEYNVTEVITCNSYKINSGNLSFSTLNEVNAIDVIESLRKISNEKMYLDDLLFNFAENYNKIQDLRNCKKALIAVGIGSVTTAGITSIMFFNNNK